MLLAEVEYRKVGKPMNLRAHQAFIHCPLRDLFRLTEEADPILPGTPLQGVLGDLVKALKGLRLGADFGPSLQSLGAALEAAVSSLQDGPRAWARRSRR
jgi:hypothetical protein